MYIFSLIYLKNQCVYHMACSKYNRTECICACTKYFLVMWSVDSLEDVLSQKLAKTQLNAFNKKCFCFKVSLFWIEIDLYNWKFRFLYLLYSQMNIISVIKLKNRDYYLKSIVKLLQFVNQMIFCADTSKRTVVDYLKRVCGFRTHNSHAS